MFTVQTIIGYLNNFVFFEREFSFWYLAFFLLMLIFLIVKNIKVIFEPFMKSKVFLLAIFVVNLICLSFISPFDDFNDSRSEDFKLAGKYYAEEQRAMICKYGNAEECFKEEKIEKLGYPFILSLFYIVFGVSLKTAFIANLLFSLISPLLLFLVLMDIVKDARVSFVGTVMYVLSYSNIIYSTSTDVYSVTTFFIILSYFCASLYFKHQNKYLFILALYSLLFVVFLRVEYILFFVVFILLNLSSFKKYILKSKMLFLVVIWLLLQIFHGLTEMKVHESAEGQLFSVMSWIFWYGELLSRSNSAIYLFLFVVVVSFSYKSIWKGKIARLALFHVVVFSFLILSFQATGSSQNYFSMVAPAFFILLSVFLRDICRQYGGKGCIVLASFIFMLTTSVLNLNPMDLRYNFRERSAKHLDEVLVELEDGIIVFTSQTMLSRAIFQSEHTAISNWNLRSEKVVEIVDSSSFENKYFIPSIYEKQNFLIFQYYETEKIMQRGEVEVYRILRKRKDLQDDWYNVFCS